MADVTIKAIRNSLYEVAGGASKNQYFYNGSHEDIGFKAEVATG
jgi:CDGSH-type Zn-finger protein